MKPQDAPAGPTDVEIAHEEPVDPAAPDKADRPGGVTIQDLVADAPLAHSAVRPLAIGMRTGSVLAVAGDRATLALGDADSAVEAAIARNVDPAVVDEAREQGNAVLVELAPGRPPVVVAVLQTQRPRALRLHAATVHIEGDQELLLRAGQSSVHLRKEGTVSIAGTQEVSVRTSQGTVRVRKDGEIELDSRSEVLLRSSKTAIRIRAEGEEIELIGSQIRATSRGLFRIVGRLLRLN